MSILAVDIFKLDSLIGDLEVLESNFNDRINTVSSSYSEVTSIYNEFGYLTSAANELAYKVDELEESRDRINAFKTIVSEFRTMAHDEESGMADRIFMDADTFMDEMGITPEYEKSAWDKFCEKVKAADEWLTDLMIGAVEFIVENWGQIVTVIGEVLIAAAAIATFIGTFPVSGVMGALSMLAAGWSAFKAVTELMGDAVSLGFSAMGEDELAEEAANYDARELFEDAGEVINDIFDCEYADEVMDAIYIALDTVELVYNVKDIFNGVISEDTHNSFDNAVDYGKFIKDLYNDNKKMSNLLGKAEISIESTLGKAIMEEGNVHESISFLIGLSED